MKIKAMMTVLFFIEMIAIISVQRTTVNMENRILTQNCNTTLLEGKPMKFLKNWKKTENIMELKIWSLGLDMKQESPMFRQRKMNEILKIIPMKEYDDNRPSYVWNVKVEVKNIIGTYPPMCGSWIISDITIVENSTIIVNGSIIIKETGALVLKNSKLYMRLKKDCEYGIDVFGNLTLINSMITSYNTTNNYFIRVFYGAKLKIENSEISYAGCMENNDKLGLWINTDNALIINSKIHHNLFGVYLYKVKNVLIKNSEIRDCCIAIFLQESSRNDITNNVIKNNTYGVYLNSSSSNSIHNNIIENNGCGVYLEGSNDNDIHSNVVLNNYEAGIDLNYARDNIIYNNTIQYNYGDGIFLWESNNNTIYDNKIQSNGLMYLGYGIYLGGSNSNVLYNNIFLNDSLFVMASYNNIVKNNTVNGKLLVYLESIGDVVIDQEAGQIILVRCKNIRIMNQNISDTDVAIELFETCDVKILNSVIQNIYLAGIFLSESINNIVYNNTIQDSKCGIYLAYSSNNSVHNNVIRDNKHGIYLWGSINNIIRSNVIRKNDFGIYFFWFSGNSAICNNVICDNRYDGIYLYFSSNNIIRNNMIQGNGANGICLLGSSGNVLLNNTFLNDSLFVLASYNNVIEGNTVNGKPLVYLEGAKNVVIDWETGQIILVKCKNIKIMNQNISNTDVAIELLEAKNVKILNSVIEGNNQVGIFLWGSSNNVIHDNIIQNNRRFGILFWEPVIAWEPIFLRTSINNTLYNNVIRKNGYGVFIWGVNGNIICNNKIQDNNYWGMCLYDSYNNVLRNNVFFNNGLFMSYSINNTIKGNIINGRPLIYLESARNVVIDWEAGQIILVRCKNVKIVNQNISNTDVGIELLETNNTKILNSVIKGNYIGIYFEESYGNVICNNTIQDNFFGVFFQISSNESSNKIFFNNFINNRYQANMFIYNQWTTTNNIAYTFNGKTYTSRLGNYWSNYNGTDDDGNGIGDIAYGNDTAPLIEPTWKYKIHDRDNDGLNDIQEEIYGTNPEKDDSDGDSFSDRIEIFLGTDPLNPDSNPTTGLFGIIIYFVISGTIVLIIIVVFLVYRRKFLSKFTYL